VGELVAEYGQLLGEIKQRIRSAQYAALKAVNKELIALYWDIGKLIVERQQGETWGKSIVEQLAKDLRAEFPVSVVFHLATFGDAGLLPDVLRQRKTDTIGGRN
jgi:hypothetical protein